MSVRLRAAALGALPLTALALLSPAAQAGPAPGPAAAPEQAVRASGGLIELRTGEAPARPTVVRERGVSAAARTATFRVRYVGFPAPARAAFQRAVDMWAENVVSSVPITIHAEYRALEPGVLGSAGATSYWRDHARFPRRGTWYPDALANDLAGRQLSSAPDIMANVSSSVSNWHFGTTPAPSGRHDFTTVVAHEIGHGLGFAGFGRLVSSTRGSIRLSDGVLNAPSIYDRFTESGTGKRLDTYADPSAGLKDVMTRGALFFDSPAVRSANGSRPAELYAPGTFQPGSSYSHLDEATYPAGNPHSLMTPRLGAGETIRTPGSITRAVYRTMGW